MPKEILLQLKDVHVRYGGVKALDGVDVAIDEGEIVALMGPNGAGKSTILKSIFGLAPIYSGSVLWHEKSITPLSYEMARMGMVFVPLGREGIRPPYRDGKSGNGSFFVKKQRRIKNKIGRVAEHFSGFKGKN